MSFRFLVVDDAAFVRELLENQLVRLGGLSVGSAESAVEAVQISQQTRPDIIFLDLVMPNKGGVDCLSELRLKCPGVKIMAFTSLDLEQLKSMGLANSFDGYIHKPFEIKDITSLIYNFLNPKSA